jgi:alginate O-acetyltransferase complex protein AlgI
MIYSSYEFFVFLPPFLIWFYCARTALTQKILLLLGSSGFLAWAGLANLLPITFVIVSVLSYFYLVDRFHSRRIRVAPVIGLLVINLAYFKYRNFIHDNMGVDLPVPAGLGWVIPLGISFYTFEAISAVLDLRRRRPPRPIDWACFIMFFPHLIAGPIVRYRMLGPQFEARKAFIWRNLMIGAHLFTVGFLKKLAADPLGQIVDPVWASPGLASGASLMLALIGFYVQLYLDFSGYTDMGRGVARMLGYRLPINFRGPFFAASPPEFYQRWHVSLSNWIRVFLYDTLALTVVRNIRSRRLQNYALLAVVLFVMSLFGLWHGSAWHFVLFGIAQGVVIVAWHAYTKGRQARSAVGWVFSVLTLQATWLLSLVFFRSDSVPAIGQFLTGTIRDTGLAYPGLQWCVAGLAATLPVQAVEYCVRRRPVARSLLALRGTRPGFALVVAVLIASFAARVVLDKDRLAASNAQPTPASAGFIYFKF